MKYTAGII